jgi:hypothetical protein
MVDPRYDPLADRDPQDLLTELQRAFSTSPSGGSTMAIGDLTGLAGSVTISLTNAIRQNTAQDGAEIVADVPLNTTVTSERPCRAPISRRFLASRR